MWPLKLAHVVLAMTYFSTGITKLLAGGLAWMNGYTLQTYVFIDGINRGTSPQASGWRTSIPSASCWPSARFCSRPFSSCPS